MTISLVVAVHGSISVLGKALLVLKVGSKPVMRFTGFGSQEQRD
jgi:hypothetical protein